MLELELAYMAILWLEVVVDYCPGHPFQLLLNALRQLPFWPPPPCMMLILTLSDGFQPSSTKSPAPHCRQQVLSPTTWRSLPRPPPPKNPQNCVPVTIPHDDPCPVARSATSNIHAFFVAIGISQGERVGLEESIRNCCQGHICKKHNMRLGGGELSKGQC